MIVATLVGVFAIPALYVVFQSLRERGMHLFGSATATSGEKNDRSEG